MHKHNFELQGLAPILEFKCGCGKIRKLCLERQGIKWAWMYNHHNNDCSIAKEDIIQDIVFRATQENGYKRVLNYLKALKRRMRRRKKLAQIVRLDVSRLVYKEELA